MRLLRITLRTLAREPVQVLAILVSLAVGIGSSAAVFALLDHILIDPLPYPEVDRIVHLWEIGHDVPDQMAVGVSYSHYETLSKASETLGAYSSSTRVLPTFI